MKSWLQSVLRKRGYEIRKAPFPGFQSAAVFDLALHYLMATRGTDLTFIEVGANDGKCSDDPLRDFILRFRWKGVLIEPQPAVFQELKANYKGLEDFLAFENVAISSDPAPLALYRLSSTAPSSVVSANPKVAAKQLQVNPNELEKIMVPTARLDDIVEWDVLRTLDLTKTRPWLIQFEHGHLPAATIGALTEHLKSHGYKVAFGGYESDSVAMRSDLLNA